MCKITRVTVILSMTYTAARAEEFFELYRPIEIDVVVTGFFGRNRNNIGKKHWSDKKSLKKERKFPDKNRCCAHRKERGWKAAADRTSKLARVSIRQFVLVR
jgi:hypothetical protein